jgi:hypothetical protein
LRREPAVPSLLPPSKKLQFARLFVAEPASHARMVLRFRRMHVRPLHVM